MYDNEKLELGKIYSKGNRKYKLDEVSGDSVYAYDEKGNLRKFDKTEFKVLYKKE